jgi:hypothetical protein
VRGLGKAACCAGLPSAGACGTDGRRSLAFGEEADVEGFEEGIRFIVPACLLVRIFDRFATMAAWLLPKINLEAGQWVAVGFRRLMPLFVC